MAAFFSFPQSCLFLAAASCAQSFTRRFLIVSLFSPFVFGNQQFAYFFETLLNFLACLGTHFKQPFDAMLGGDLFYGEGLHIAIGGGLVGLVADQEYAGVVAIIVLSLLDPVLENTLDRWETTSKLL